MSRGGQHSMNASLDGKCCDNRIVDIAMMRTLVALLSSSAQVLRLETSGPTRDTQNRKIDEKDVGSNGELQQRDAFRARFPLKIYQRTDS